MGFTIEDKEPLRKANNKAINKKEDTFKYKGALVVVSYCKYMLELMDMY